jgi:DNA invertase Pin-like site-specific DNA recombinase
MIIGYARVSTQDQNPNFQVDTLEKAGAEQIF